MQDNDMQIIPVAYCIDEAVVIQCMVSIHSLIDTFCRYHCNDNLSLKIHVVVTDTMPEESRIRLQSLTRGKKATVSLSDAGDIFANSYVRTGFPAAAYFRLIIPWMFDLYDKVLYLDYDTVVKGDIVEIFKLASDNCLIWAAKETTTFISSVSNKHIIELGLNPSRYFNSGIILFNNARFRECISRERIKELADQEHYFLDQDVLNILCHETKDASIGHLPAKYNYLANFTLPFVRSGILRHGTMTEKEYDEAVMNPVIIHYAGINKPWNTYTVRYMDWWEAAAKIGYYDVNKINKIENYQYFRIEKDIPNVRAAFMILLSRIKRYIFRLIGRPIRACEDGSM